MTDKLKEIEDYLRTWLDNFRSASQVAPVVQESLEEVSWARQALSLRPPEAANVSSTQVDDWAAAAHLRITSLLPEMPAYLSSLSTQVNSTTSSSNTAVLSYIVDVGQIGTPATVSFAADQVKAYRQLQDKHHRPDRVRSLVLLRFPSVVARFDAAAVAYRQHLAGLGSDAGAAVDMRTATDGIQGELFQLARTHPGEKMTWSLMAQRIGRDASHRLQLENQEIVRVTLYAHLSSIAKRRADAGTPTLDAVWSIYLDHLQAVLA